MKFEEEKQDNPAILETGRVKTPNSRRKRVVKCQVYDELKRLFKIVDKIEEMWPAKGDDVAWLNFSENKCPTFELVKRQRKYACYTDLEVSKFCLTDLLKCQRKLCCILKEECGMTNEDIREGSCLSLSVDDSTKSSVKMYRWSQSPLPVKVLDFSRELWLNIEEHVSYQTSTLQRIICALDKTWRNECLELRGFPLLSEFNVSVVFILGHFFEKVGLIYPNSKRNVIFFHTFQNIPTSVKMYLEKALLEKDVQSLASLKDIFNKKIYNSVKDSNNIFLKKQSLQILNVFLLEDEK